MQSITRNKIPDTMTDVACDGKAGRDVPPAMPSEYIKPLLTRHLRGIGRWDTGIHSCVIRTHSLVGSLDCEALRASSNTHNYFYHLECAPYAPNAEPSSIV